jgi:adenosylcobinamide-GDP ribazoletransferase
VRAFLVACRYLTTLPLPRGEAGGDLGAAAGWFPVVGLLLGAVLAGASLLLAWAVPPLVAAVLLVGLWAGLTGGLHLDGLADAADGLGGGFSRAEALAIMRDARTGAFGVVAIVLVLAAKGAALASLPPELRWRGLVVAPTLGRLAPLVLARACAPARADGAGHAFVRTVAGRALAPAAAVALGVAVMLFGAWGVLLVAGVVAAAAAFAWYLRGRLGGVTGDCLGAMVELGEAGVLVVLTALAHGGRL